MSSPIAESCIGDLEAWFGDSADCDTMFNDVNFEQELARADPSGPPRSDREDLGNNTSEDKKASTTMPARDIDRSATDRMDRLLFGGHRLAQQQAHECEEDAIEAPMVRILVINSSPMSNDQTRATLQGAACSAFRNTNFEHILCSSADRGVEVARRALAGGAASAFNIVFISSIIASRRNGVSCSYEGVVKALQDAGCKAPIVIMDVSGGKEGSGLQEPVRDMTNVRVVSAPSGGFSVRLYVQLLRESLQLEDPVASMAIQAAAAVGEDGDDLSPNSPGTPPIGLPNPWLQWSVQNGKSGMQMHTGMPPNKATELVALQCRGAVFPGAVLPVFDVPLSVAASSFPNCLQRRQQRMSAGRNITPIKRSPASYLDTTLGVGRNPSADLYDRARKRQRIIRAI